MRESNTQKEDYYWDTHQESVINKFITDETLDDSDLKDLYENELYDVMDQMIRILIYKNNFYETGIRNSDLVKRCHSKVYGVLVKSRENQDKYYQPDRQTSFSYFTRIITNYLIDLQQENQQKSESHISTDNYELNVLTEENEIDYDYLFTQSINYIEANYQNIFKKEDTVIVEAFIRAVRQNDESINGRKDLRPIVFSYIDDMNQDEFNLQYYQVKTVINRIYRKLKNKYLDHGEINNQMKITVN